MKTIGAPPGAATFRLGLMIIIVAILVVIFFRYVDQAQVAFERQSVLQTKRIVDSSLAVVFARYAVKRRLDDIGELDGANPFEFLAQYSNEKSSDWGIQQQLLPTAYRGSVEQDPGADANPGWYYLKHRRQVAYLPTYLDRRQYVAIVLRYEDGNGSGRFEPEADTFRSLQVVELNESSQ